MTQKRPFRWSAKTEAAAVLVADDEISDEEIATEVGVDRSTLKRWKRDPEFRERVHLHVERLARELSKYRIARKDKRVAALNDRWERAQNVILARANDPDLQDVPEGTTGLVVKKPTMVVVYEADGDGDDEALTTQRTVQLRYEYAVDTGLMAEMRQMEKQAAQEAGQWTEKAETTHTGEVTMRTYRGVDVEAV